MLPLHPLRGAGLQPCKSARASRPEGLPHLTTQVNHGVEERIEVDGAERGSCRAGEMKMSDTRSIRSSRSILNISATRLARSRMAGPTRCTRSAQPPRPRVRAGCPPALHGLDWQRHRQPGGVARVCEPRQRIVEPSPGSRLGAIRKAPGSSASGRCSPAGTDRRPFGLFLDAWHEDLAVLRTAPREEEVSTEGDCDRTGSTGGRELERGFEPT